MSFDPGRVKAICFDVDGTLSDTDDQWVAQIEERLRSIKPLLLHSDLHKTARWMVMVSESPMNAVYHWADALSLDDNIARIYERLIRSHKQAKRNFWLMAGALEILDDLAGRYPLSIVSARDELTTRSFVEQYSLEKLFLALATSQTCEHTKPYPHPVLWAADRMHAAPETCVMIGDTTVDILAGKRAGAQTIGLLCGFGTERELRRAGADLVVKDLKELKEYFK
jgi:HAD superfamily hydrolase (TIGR01549 family)